MSYASKPKGTVGRYYYSNLFAYTKSQNTQYLNDKMTRRDLEALSDPNARRELAEFNRRFAQAQIYDQEEIYARSQKSGVPLTPYDSFPEEWLKEIGMIDEDFDWDEEYKED